MGNGKPTMTIYNTKSKARFPKPVVNCYYASNERMAEALQQFKDAEEAKVARRLARKAERRAERRAMKQNGHGINVGDCLVASWGYDQTNVDFFQVVRVSASSVWFRAICGEAVEGSEGFMSNRVRPVKDAWVSEDTVVERKRGTHCKRVQKSGDSYYVSHERLHLRPTSWDSDHYCSWYA